MCYLKTYILASNHTSKEWPKQPILLYLTLYMLTVRKCQKFHNVKSAKLNIMRFYSQSSIQKVYSVTSWILVLLAVSISSTFSLVILSLSSCLSVFASQSLFLNPSLKARPLLLVKKWNTFI